MRLWIILENLSSEPEDVWTILHVLAWSLSLKTYQDCDSEPMHDRHLVRLALVITEMKPKHIHHCSSVMNGDTIPEQTDTWDA